jgi:hypothetical protein
MSSILERYPCREEDSLALSRSECGGILDLCLPRAMRRVPHFLLAVALTRSDLRRFNLLLRKLMGGSRGGRLRASYYVRTAYARVRQRSLNQILSDGLLPDVIHELAIRLEDDRRSIEMLFSRRGVVCRVMGGASDELWEAETQRAISAFLAEKRARFLVPLLSPVVFLPGGAAFYMMYTMTFGSNELNSWALLFYTAYIFVSFSSAALFFLHRQGILFPHARIAIRDLADRADSGNKALLINFLSLIIQLIRLLAGYHLAGARLTRKLWWQLPAYGTVPPPRASS